jgi:hypothetical protein
VFIFLVGKKMISSLENTTNIAKKNRKKMENKFPTVEKFSVSNCGLRFEVMSILSEKLRDCISFKLVANVKPRKWGLHMN